MSNEVNDKLGPHEARIIKLETDVIEIKRFLLQVKGGWKVFVFILGLLGLAVGAGLIKLFQTPVHQAIDYWP